MPNLNTPPQSTAKNDVEPSTVTPAYLDLMRPITPRPVISETKEQRLTRAKQRATDFIMQRHEAGHRTCHFVALDELDYLTDLETFLQNQGFTVIHETDRENHLHISW